MIEFDERSINKLIADPDSYLLCLRGTREYTLSAERKGIGSWLRSRYLDKDSYDLPTIIFNLRKNRNFSDSFIEALDLYIKRQQSDCLSLSEQMQLHKEWQKVVIKYLIEKLKKGAILELTLKNGRNQWVEFSHFYEQTILYCHAIDGRASQLHFSETDLRSIRIVAYAKSQWNVMQQTLLPGVDYRSREYLKSRGVEFRGASKAVLPESWKKVPREHPLWIDIFDERGNKVGELFHRSEEYEEVSKFRLTTTS